MFNLSDIHWFHPSFEPGMKNKQVEYTGWFHLKVLNQTWSTDKLNIQGDYIQRFWRTRTFNLDGITLYIQLVCSSYLVQNLDGITHMQGDSIQKFWTRHEVLTNWTFRKIQSKSFESDMKNKLNIQSDSIQIATSEQFFSYIQDENI
jgi:hypothetical protein